MIRYKIIMIGLLVLAILLAAGLGAFLYVRSQSTGPTPKQTAYIDSNLDGADKVGNQPTQDVTLPGGKITKAMAGEIRAKITNQETINSFGSRIKKTPTPDLYSISVPPNSDLLGEAKKIKQLPGVAYAEPNYVTSGQLETRVNPNDTEYNNQETLVDISVPEAWMINRNGPLVAVLDSGVQTTHPDLAGKLVMINGVNGFDFVNGSISPDGQWVNDADGADDDYVGDTGHGHGTQVAGIIAANTNNSRGIAGISWSSSILSLKVLDSDNRGNTSFTANAIRYATDHGARVINMSLGTACPNTTDCTGGEMNDAINYARSRGVVLLAASGNANVHAVNSPASHRGVIAVGGSTPGNAVARQAGASFEYPPGTGDIYGSSSAGANWGPQIAVIAPFYANYATRPGGLYERFGGTSAATPMTSGVVALMLGANPVLTPEQVKNMLMVSANEPAGTTKSAPPYPRVNDEVGAGRVNAYRAVLCARNCH